MAKECTLSTGSLPPGGLPRNSEVRITSFFTSSEPSGLQGNLIVYPCSGVLPSSVCQREREGRTKVYINSPGHMTKMADMPIHGETIKIFSYRIKGHMILKFGMQHRALSLYKVYINEDPGLTLTHLTAMSN